MVTTLQMVKWMMNPLDWPKRWERVSRLSSSVKVPLIPSLNDFSSCLCTSSRSPPFYPFCILIQQLRPGIQQSHPHKWRIVLASQWAHAGVGYKILMERIGLKEQQTKKEQSLFDSFPLQLGIVFPLSGRLDQLFNDLVVVAVLAVFILVGSGGVVLDLELIGECEVVGIDAARGGGQCGVAVLLGPLVEDAGEEGGVPGLDFLVVGLYHRLLVEVVLDRVAQHQQVGVDPLELLAAEGGGLGGVVLPLEVPGAGLEAGWGQGYMMLNCSTWEGCCCARRPWMMRWTWGVISMSSLKRSGSLLQQGSTSLRMWERKMISNWLRWKILQTSSSSSQGQCRACLSAVLWRISFDLQVNPDSRYSSSSYWQADTPCRSALILPRLEFSYIHLKYIIPRSQWSLANHNLQRGRKALEVPAAGVRVGIGKANSSFFQNSLGEK